MDAPPLLMALLAQAAQGHTRFHMPGHAGRAVATGGFPGLPEALYRFDQTEVDGLDVLSEPTGCLAEAQARAADAFGVRDSFFLVNGTTVGLQAAMLAALHPGDRVLIPRNAHRSVIAGLILTGAEPVWVRPAWDDAWGLWQGLTLADIAPHLPDVRAVLVTSPTYEGLASEVAAITAACHKAGVLCLVDEAHGALWPFSEGLPTSACQSSADAVVQSLHKTGGSLTQTALLHLPVGSRLSAERVQQALNTLHTTSPSYLLMASLDATRAFLASPPGRAHLDARLARLLALRARVHERCRRLQLFTPPRGTAWDPMRLWLRGAGVAGDVWADWVETQHGVAYEQGSPHGALYLAGIGQTRADDDALLAALLAADAHWPHFPQAAGPPSSGLVPTALPERVLSPRDAFFAPGERVPAADAPGRIAQETVVHCPPGIPILLPGERIRPEHGPFLPERVGVVAE